MLEAQGTCTYNELGDFQVVSGIGKAQDTAH